VLALVIDIVKNDVGYKKVTLAVLAHGNKALVVEVVDAKECLQIRIGVIWQTNESRSSLCSNCVNSKSRVISLRTLHDIVPFGPEFLTIRREETRAVSLVGRQREAM
jgi:hypothetical protein